MHRTNLRKVGGSVMLAVPPALLDLLDLAPGTEVGIGVDGGRLIVEPRQRPHYTLAELLAQCDSSRKRSRREHKWLRDKPVGRELI
jgi:antitoxin ChpS